MRLRPISMLLCTIVIGCADTKGPATRPMTIHERQDEALRDPFGYGPKLNRPTEVPRVSGGGIGDFDRKAFDRDLERVLGGP